MIILNNNKGFKWYTNEKCNFKGYFYYKDNYYEKEDALDLLSRIDSYDEFRNLINQINGCFAIIIKSNQIWIAVDIARSIPIFYTTDGMYISDSAEHINEIINSEIDTTSLAEMLLSYNCSSGNTVYSYIKQVQLGEIVQINKDCIRSEFYFKHIHDNKDTLRENLLSKFTEVSEEVFDRLIDSLNGRTVIIPLSGGYDSRYIIAMLKKKGYSNVICYTYGNENDYEVQYSKKIAKTLGYKWYFVEYTKQMWKNFFEDKKKDDYFEYTHNHSSLPHIQDFLALKTLIKEERIPKDSIVIPGFCGDLPAGSFVNKDIEGLISNKNELVEYIFSKHFINTKCNSEIERCIKERIYDYLDSMDVQNFDYEGIISLYESWFTSDRPSMWVVNSNRVYEFFNLEWRMPLWDKVFLEFWYSVKSDFRIECNLYIEWLFENLFIPLSIDMKKPGVSKFVNNKPIERELKILIKRLLIYIGMKIGIDLYKRNNINNYNEASIYFYKMIKNKKCFDYNFQSVHQLEALWWCEHRYGVEYVKEVLKKG